MNKEEINDKSTECISKMHILFIIRCLLLGAVLELVLGIDNANKAIPLVVMAIAIFQWFYKNKDLK